MSTLSGWMGVLSDLCGPSHAPDLSTEDQAKHKVLKILFGAVFYGFTNCFIRKNMWNLNTPSFLRLAATHLRRFSLLSVDKPLRALAAEKRSLLGHLEECIDTVLVSPCVSVSKKETQTVLYILHRLLDHGVARKLVVQAQCPVILAWLLPALPPVSLRWWCPRRTVSTWAGGAAGGQSVWARLSERAERSPAHLLLPALSRPAQLWCVGDAEVMRVARALRRLHESSRSLLAELSISVLPCLELLEVLLAASPSLTSVHVEIQSVWGFQGPPAAESHVCVVFPAAELPLKMLTLKVGGSLTEAELIQRVLRRAPHLASLHLCGVRLAAGRSQAGLLTTLAESNRVLRTLTLEDIKLSDCLPQLQNLLRSCSLEELHLSDCRLLETWSQKEESLRQLVSSLRSAASLHTLGLPQNRLAKHVFLLAELFSGSSTSSLRRLDLSSNFIQPAELLDFARRLKTHPPPRRLTLDLRKNPGDRAPDQWKAALQLLRPWCVVLAEGWTSTNTMADHVSNM
uniref:Leucine-rich repeat-containing protein 41 n=1 Tax=Tetraodon nigroviridis TaxID=99883 RepID=H3C1R2_TETNG